MLMFELGEGKFLDGLRHYIRRHRFESTESKDLWLALQAATGQEVATRMDVWTNKVGYPIVRVTEEHSSDDQGRGGVVALRLRQDRFVVDGAEGVEIESPIYPLQITVRSESGVDTFPMNEREITIPTGGKTFLKINADHNGFFRTCYSSTHLQRLIKAVGTDYMSPRDCIGLLADMAALTAAGISRTSELLDLCLGFRLVTSFPVWQMIDQNLTKIMSIWKFEDSSLTGAMKKAAAGILGPVAHELGFDMSHDDESRTAFKACMFSGAGLAGDPM